VTLKDFQLDLLSVTMKKSLQTLAMGKSLNPSIFKLHIHTYSYLPGNNVIANNLLTSQGKLTSI